MNPNSQHQLWSEWTFDVFENGKHPSFTEVRDNVRKWLRKGFGSVGRVRVIEKVRTWKIIAQFEGVPAHDPYYVDSVRQQFQKNFVEKGWGLLTVSSVEVKVLAGDIQDGQPSSQLVMMPVIRREGVFK